MKNLFFIAAFVAAGIACSLKAGATELKDMKYVDARSLHIIGMPYETPLADYARLPEQLREELRGSLVSLGVNSAGVAVRFSSDSPVISAKWRVRNHFSMNHMPDTGIRGLDLYVLDGNKWRYVGTAKPGAKESISAFVRNGDNELKEYVAYLPLYDGVESLEIGVEPGSLIEKPRNNSLTSNQDKKPVIFYGTSITQGGCASRPGMAYPAILGRMMNRETINLGFSGNARMDKAMAKAINMVDFHTLVLDCLPNMSAQMVRDSAEYFLRSILKINSEKRIIMVENPVFPNLFLDKNSSAEIVEENSEWRALYDKLRREGFKNIKYVKGEGLIGDDSEATVDAVHLTDLGFLRFSESLIKYLK
ncbi:MAG: SGNH/GDSL hydrolase family protein [Bacteroidales bacterium]|nr:SGNH/GDSL hydrolase family protein [Bacteroidales bacterium]MDD3273667.1 SGNH/GDSL hydrolase family protein [Bacteroidales bacterium]MDD4058270.1 SGNH/GDSL hydrolase family protein [Bacteroidales bacterium]